MLYDINTLDALKKHAASKSKVLRLRTGENQELIEVNVRECGEDVYEVESFDLLSCIASRKKMKPST